MGGTSYSYSSAMHSRSVKNTMSNSIDENFKQNRLRRAHDSMKSQGIDIRESRDSEVHPETFPIIIALDLTGSMGHIPQELIKTGLPTLVTELIKSGVKSPAILFLGVGDHVYDSEPLQVGQFESGDVELDMWLERTYLEGGGGGNPGESYFLAHYFAARHTVTDAWEKRKQKGLLITIGDEPCLGTINGNTMNEIMGETNRAKQGFNSNSIIKEAQEKWHVVHIDPRNGRNAHGWSDLLGQNFIKLNGHEDIPNVIVGLVNDYIGTGVTKQAESQDTPENKEEIL